jgi:hypothetical protein
LNAPILPATVRLFWRAFLCALGRMDEWTHGGRAWLVGLKSRRMNQKRGNKNEFCHFFNPFLN